MHTITRAARRRGHLSRHERQRLARAQAFSRRTPKLAPAPTPQKLERDQVELIDRLVRTDRTAVSRGAASDRRDRFRRSKSAGGA